MRTQKGPAVVGEAVVGDFEVGLAVVGETVVGDAVTIKSGGPTHTKRAASAAMLRSDFRVEIVTPCRGAFGKPSPRVNTPREKKDVSVGCNFWFTSTRVTPAA